MLNKRVSCMDCGHKAFPHHMKKMYDGCYKCQRCFKTNWR